MSIAHIINVVATIIVFLAGAFVCFQYKRTAKKTGTAIALAGLLLIELTVLSFPPSNLFVRFDMPYDAYNASQNGEVLLTIEGARSALVVAAEDGSSAYCTSIIPKGTDGWKIPGIFASHKVADKQTANLIMQIDHARGTSDYYVSVYSIGAEIAVSDSMGSVFEKADTRKSGESGMYAYYAWVGSFDETYSLTINGEDFFDAQ